MSRLIRKKTLTRGVFYCLSIILLLGGISLITYRISKTIKINQAVQAYYEFLRGESSVGNEDVYQLITPTGEPEKRLSARYCIWDVDGDGIPELHFLTGREYTIYTYKNGKMKWFYIIASEPPRNVLLDSGAFIEVYMTGSASDGYYYFELDRQGKATNKLRFAWTDTNENYECDEEDEFIFEGELCTKEEWLAKTEKYLFLNDEGRTEVKNPVAWTEYCEEKWLVFGDRYEESVME